MPLLSREPFATHLLYKDEPNTFSKFKTQELFMVVDSLDWVFQLVIRRQPKHTLKCTEW